MNYETKTPSEFTQFAHEELAKFYDEWPGGLDEVEASIRGWRERAKKFESDLAAALAVKERAEAERDLAAAQLLAVGSVLCGDDKGETRDNARWTPTLDVARALAAKLAAAERDQQKMREWCDSMRRYGAENKGEAMLAIVAEMQAYSIKREAIDAARGVKS